eukprot:TRINITY_DN2238_c0_g1_i3.p1 TRINITY_DN2238_c0_g1~~TRINITY_DN2238_c0_g1_i3.p1  ORF type:complete len:201 (-),score=46.99 TRINITY_DN2238_c0_g1_i3:22-594(-)
MADNHKEVSVMFYGSSGVGCTTIAVQFTSGFFLEEYDPTIESSYRRQYLSNDRVYLVDILDVAGEEEYTAQAEASVRKQQNFIIVYDIVSRRSFEHLDFISKMIRRVKEDVPFTMVLVGNKKDLDAQRTVSTQDGINFAEHYGIPFLETSAKSRQDCEKIFDIVCQQAIDKNGGKIDERSQTKKHRCIVA